MRFAITLDLRHFDNGFMRRAPPSIIGRHWAAVWTGEFEHQAIGEIAVMRDRKHFAVCRLFIGVHIIPQLVNTAIVPKRTERQHFVGLILAIAEHHHAVQIVTARHQCIFKSHKRGELAGLIITFNNAGMFGPDFSRAFFVRNRITQRRRQRICRSHIDKLSGNTQRSFGAFVHLVMPFAQLRVADE